ncbi:MAG: hypothetical protein ACI8RD_001055 [Bacillariaceae sp.]|jgi:hypothetical protein
MFAPANCLLYHIICGLSTRRALGLHCNTKSYSLFIDYTRLRHGRAVPLMIMTSLNNMCFLKSIMCSLLDVQYYQMMAQQMEVLPFCSEGTVVRLKFLSNPERKIDVLLYCIPVFLHSRFFFL